MEMWEEVNFSRVIKTPGISEIIVCLYSLMHYANTSGFVC
jgi:hypothetical protein